MHQEVLLDAGYCTDKAPSTVSEPQLHPDFNAARLDVPCASEAQSDTSSPSRRLSAGQADLGAVPSSLNPAGCQERHVSSPGAAAGPDGC